MRKCLDAAPLSTVKKKKEEYEKRSQSRKENKILYVNDVCVCMHACARAGVFIVEKR